MNQLIKNILAFNLLVFSLNLNAQTKYIFSSSGVRFSEANTEFWGKSSNREISIKWNNDIWLSPSSYRIDSISGFFEIDDNYKSEKCLLKVMSSEDSLTYSFTKNGRT